MPVFVFCVLCFWVFAAVISPGQTKTENFLKTAVLLLTVVATAFQAIAIWGTP